MPERSQAAGGGATARGGWLRAWLAPTALALLFLALARWSWRKWADVVVDFGAELYVPWRLSLGERLYEDIAYRHGALSPHLNALVFRAVGPSVDALVFTNLVILALLCVLVHRIFTALFDATSGAVATVVLLVLFGFSQYVGIGNYNYVTPYQHAQTHGLVLSVGMLLALGALLRRPGRVSAAVGGLCLGLVLLTKLELQVPALATAVLAAVLLQRSSAQGTHLLWLLAGAATPPIVAALLLLATLSPALALEGLLGNWSHLGSLSGDRFYLKGAGLDDPFGHLVRALAATLGLVGFAGVAALADRRASGMRGLGALAVGVGAAVGLLLVVPAAGWLGLARALPVVAGATAGLAIAACVRGSGSGAVARHGPLALWATFSLLLLGKMLLRARFEHYGFVLAMPATLLLVALLAGWLPATLQRRYGGGRLARAVALGGISAACLFFLVRTDDWYARKSVPVGGGSDVLLTDARRGRILGETLAQLGSLAAPDDSVLVLPEGVGINYWLRRRIPSRHYLFLPAEFAALGEETMLAELREAAPDWVLLVDRPHEEFGVGAFGTDPRNGAALLGWVRDHYDVEEVVGAEPFGGAGFGIEILKRTQ